MFIVKEHFEYSDACFPRAVHPDNRDMCVCADFCTLPSPFGKGLIRIVMDGMSDGDGKEAVEIAAQALMHHLVAQLMITSRSMAECIESNLLGGVDSDVTREQLQEWVFSTIRTALTATNATLCSSSLPKPCCTVSVAVVFHRYIFTANLGDSPICLMDLTAAEPELIPLFACHNVAGEMIASGMITEEEALHSSMASQLRLFLGCRDYDLVSQAHYAVRELPPSSILLLGSDGALSQLTRRAMASIVSSHRFDGLAAIHDELLLQVGESGSVDDFTLVMDWIETD